MQPLTPEGKQGDVRADGAGSPCRATGAFSDVVVIFACNGSFVPYFSTAMQSLIEHTSPDRRYDIVVMCRDIPPDDQWTLTRQVDAIGHDLHLHFVDMAARFGADELPVHGHFHLETYFRLVAPQVLADVRKAVYLDSDIVVLDDVAKLFDTDVDGLLLAATRDADTIGQAMGYNATVTKYLHEVVGLSSVLDYFQAGVLLMNLEEFRRSFAPGELVRLATSRHWHWLDQDVLNYVGRGRTRFVDMSWNALNDWRHKRRSLIVAQAPQEVRDEFDRAREDARIVHYAGPDDRPWLYPQADRADLFWRYARSCPYHDELVRRLEQSRRTVRGRAKRIEVGMLYNFWMPLFDFLFKPGTYVRVGAIHVISIFSGHILML